MHDDSVVTDFVSTPGMGASAFVDAQKFVVGNHRMAHETGVCSDSLETLLNDVEQRGNTAIVVMSQTLVLGVIALSDTLR